jgi:hypothetical protein
MDFMELYLKAFWALEAGTVLGSGAFFPRRRRRLFGRWG